MLPFTLLAGSLAQVLKIDTLAIITVGSSSLNVRGFMVLAVWISGMVPARGAQFPRFDSQSNPLTAHACAGK